MRLPEWLVSRGMHELRLRRRQARLLGLHGKIVPFSSSRERLTLAKVSLHSRSFQGCPGISGPSELVCRRTASAKRSPCETRFRKNCHYQRLSGPEHGKALEGEGVRRISKPVLSKSHRHAHDVATTGRSETAPGFTVEDHHGFSRPLRLNIDPSGSPRCAARSHQSPGDSMARRHADRYIQGGRERELAKPPGGPIRTYETNSAKQTGRSGRTGDVRRRIYRGLAVPAAGRSIRYCTASRRICSSLPLEYRRR